MFSCYVRGGARLLGGCPEASLGECMGEGQTVPEEPDAAFWVTDLHGCATESMSVSALRVILGPSARGRVPSLGIEAV